MRTMSRIIAASLAVVALMALPGVALAAPGAGIDKGTIAAPDPARPGASYELETLTLFNTGDTAATYEMLVVPVNKEDKLSPESEWFTFEPQSFELAPGAHEQVKVTMQLPNDAPAGSYEALLGGRPVLETEGVLVRVGAAARLKMEVAQSNIFASAFYGTLSLVQNNAPWSYVIIAAVLIALALTIFLVIRSRMADEYDDEDESDNDSDNGSHAAAA